MKNGNKTPSKASIDSKCNRTKSVRRSAVRKSRRNLRNATRKNRRKRSCLRYYTALKQSRCSRKTNDLFSALTVFDITDMEMTPNLSNTTTEVVEWHNQEQIAYWKSRALSLEYENRMLLQHLRNTYAKQTEDYANFQQEPIESKKAVQQKRDKVLMVEPVGIRRRREMRQLYGDKAEKIMGMETATQLNYELRLEEEPKVRHWPHTALNLNF